MTGKETVAVKIDSTFKGPPLRFATRDDDVI